MKSPQYYLWLRLRFARTVFVWELLRKGEGAFYNLCWRKGFSDQCDSHPTIKSKFLDLQLFHVIHWVMSKTFAKELKTWRGSRIAKEAASDLDIPLPTYRKYEYGKRTPGKLAMIELKRRMESK